MDMISAILGFLVAVWGILQLIYPEESKWFHKRWNNYLKSRMLTISLAFILFGLISLIIVWYSNSFLALMVLGSFLMYTAIKYLVFGNKIIELSEISLKASKNRWRIMGLWLVLGGLGLIYLSTWF
jgi:hypothetical protein